MRKPAPIARLYGGKWMGGVAYGLRRLSKGAQEASAHPLTVAKAGFLGDFLDWQPSLLEHISGRLKTKILDGAGRRLTGFRAKHPGKLPRAEPRRVCELLHRERLSKVVPGKGERVLDAVGFRVELEHRRVLRLSAGASMMNDHHLGGRAGDIPPKSRSTRPSAMSMPAVIPAEVQTGPSAMKMRSISTRTFGKRRSSS